MAGRIFGCRRILLSIVVSLLILRSSEAGAASFVRVQSGVFVDGDCREFKFSGYNAWQVIEAALDMCCGGRTALVQQFQDAARNNLTVVRMFGFPVQEGFNLQTAPGIYNEEAFRGLDIVIAEAAKQKLRLIIAFANNWAYNDLQTDWKCAYTNWTTTARNCNDFFTDANAIKLYKQHVKTVLKRVNTVTGVAYANDPTILAWNLMNEPRNEHKKGAAELQSWIKKVAPFVKRQAPNQLLTVGTEGFYQPSNCAVSQLNPVPAGWPFETGQDHLPNHALAAIDYAGIHLWPDVWSRDDRPWGLSWLQAHADNAALLGKPLVVEEFGKFVGGIYDRQHTENAGRQLAYYKKVYEEVGSSVLGSGAIKGILFWRWKAADPTIVLGTDDQAATLDTEGKVFRQVIAPFSARVAKAAADAKRPAVKGCVPANLVATPATLNPGGLPPLQPPPQPAAAADIVVTPSTLAGGLPLPPSSVPATPANSGTAAQSAPAAPMSSAAAKIGSAAVLPPPVASLAHPAAVQAASAAQPLAVGQVSGDESAPTVSTPTGLVLPQAAAGRKLRAAAASKIAVAPVDAREDTSFNADDPAAAAEFAQSTFSTPPGITPENINSKVVCTSAADTTPAAAAG